MGGRSRESGRSEGVKFHVLTYIVHVCTSCVPVQLRKAHKLYTDIELHMRKMCWTPISDHFESAVSRSVGVMDGLLPSRNKIHTDCHLARSLLGLVSWGDGMVSQVPFICVGTNKVLLHSMSVHIIYTSCTNFPS